MPDANMDAYLSTIMNSFYGAAGQRCLANSLVLPVGAAHAEARERVAEAASRLRLGDGLEPGVDLGPVVSAAARDRIFAAIANGVEEGAEAVLDGRQVSVPERPKGYFVGPTLLDGVRPEMRVYREEIFGPVVGMTPVDEPGRGDRADQRGRVRQRRLDLHRERRRGAPVPLRGRDRQRRDQRRRRGAGRLLPVQRRQALVLRHAPPAGPRRGPLLHREQGGHHPLDDGRWRDGHRRRPIVRER